MSIQPLPSDVIAQIKSSTAITSLNGVICELMKNSLDADSSKISITVDYGRGDCVVEDNGVGIAPFEFSEDGGLGKPYHSSKLKSQALIHGRHGNFVASLSSMAVLTITSHDHLYLSHNTISMHKSAVVSRQTPALPSHYLANKSHGTRVSVRDLFGNMPVRVKQRANFTAKQRGNAKEWEELKGLVVALLLCWPKDVTIDVREVGVDQKMIVHNSKASDQPKVSQICSILSQALYIPAYKENSWVSVGARTRNVKVSGIISLEPSATKHIQFICLGIQPLSSVSGQRIFHDDINRWFSNTAFGNEEDMRDINGSEKLRRARDKHHEHGGYTSKELKGDRKGVKRWPMFYINIRMKQLDTTLSSELLDVENIREDQGNVLPLVLELLQSMVLEFLARHHFCPKSTLQPRSKKGLTTSYEHHNIGVPLVASKLSETPEKHGPARSRSSKQHLKPDSLETNVKVSSFRHPSTENAALFDSWSRVKASNIARKSRTVPSLSVLKDPNPKPNPQPSIALPLSDGAAPILNGTSAASREKILTASLISKEGKVIRRPFRDVAVNVPQAEAITVQTNHDGSSDVSDPAYDHNDDNVVLWINPVTKVTSLVNRQTGITIPAKRAPSTGLLAESSIPSRLKMRTPNSIDASPNHWVTNLLKDWQNPVFCPVSKSIPKVSSDAGERFGHEMLRGRRHHCSRLDIDRTFKDSVPGLSGRISKEALKTAEVISQVDNKFILAKLVIHSQKSTHEEVMLVLIDQHAADERIRIEGLLEELFSAPHVGFPLASGIRTEPLDKPLVFEISNNEADLLQEHKSHFRNWGIFYDLSHSETVSTMTKTAARDTHQTTVRFLPPGIIERCKLEPRLLIGLIRTEAWNANGRPRGQPRNIQGSWPERVHFCPQGILDMLNSRACRSSIMFNDKLSVEHCHILIQKLALCRFPFQCAHGRPSLVPLVGLEDLEIMGGIDREESTKEFDTSYTEWKQKFH